MKTGVWGRDLPEPGNHIGEETSTCVQHCWRWSLPLESALPGRAAYPPPRSTVSRSARPPMQRTRSRPYSTGAGAPAVTAAGVRAVTIAGAAAASAVATAGTRAASGAADVGRQPGLEE